MNHSLINGYRNTFLKVRFLTILFKSNSSSYDFIKVLKLILSVNIISLSKT